MARESNSVETYMPLVIEKYQADTMELSTLQHGAYLLLLMAYWRRGGPLPADDSRLASIAKLSPQEWKKHRSVLSEFFEERDGQWHQKRADAELARARAKSEAAAESARARWARKASGDADGMRTHKPTHSEGISGGNAPPSKDISDANASSIEGASERVEPAKKPRRKPEIPLPSSWEPKEAHYALAAKLGLTAEHVPRVGQAMRDWAASHDHRRADWDATMNTFLSREANNGRSGQHGQSVNGRGPSAAEAAFRAQRERQLAGQLRSGGSGSGEPDLWREDDRPH